METFLLIANTFLSVFASTPFLLIPIVGYLIFATFLQRKYMNCSRELYRLESISKSPILSYFGETVLGLPIIRSFNKQMHFLNNHAKNLDENRKVYIYQIAVELWFQMIL
jgi:ATP-binding cassette subfamily C (CFTR/MRP) protein 2